MLRSKTFTRGFTLIELALTVAIMGILAATALSLFSLQQLRAKRTEAMTNVEAIAKLERGYFGENGTYPTATPTPPGAPGDKQNWDPTGVPFSFEVVGFEANGSVFYVYDVNSAAGGGCTCPSGACFTVSAYGDSDKDGNLALVGYFHGDDIGVVCNSQVLAAVGPPIDPSDGSPILDQPVDVFTFSGPIVDDY
jgi:prepilin-type N-terminal cleavage/methylation domain-containing protein